MTPRHTIIMAVAATIAAVAWPGETRADAFENCRMAARAEARLAACSEVIASAAYSVEQKAIAYRNRGRARAEAGALDLALADLDAAVRLGGGADIQTYTYRGLVRVRRGDLDGAIADYGEVVRLNPRSAVGFSGRGYALLVKGAEQQAIADFSEAIRLNPKSASTFNNRGLAYRKSGDIGRAIDDFTAAILLNPIYAVAYANRGYAYESQGRKAEAIQDLQRALLFDPSHVGARDALKRLHGGSALAEETARRVKEGEALVAAHCQSCHAIGRDGVSPKAGAPPFRTLHARHPMQALREPLTRAIAAPHDEMPKFALADEQIDRIVAYINSLDLPP